MKRTLLALCLLPLLAGSAFAKDIKIPADSPVASVTLPAGWTSEETDNGISCQSKDGDATIFFEVAKGESETNALIDENIKFLSEQKVTIDKSSQKERSFEGAGLTWQVLEYSGKDESGDEHIQMMFTEIKPGKVMMITYWVTTKAESTYKDQLVKLFDSFKKL